MRTRALMVTVAGLALTLAYCAKKSEPSSREERVLRHRGAKSESDRGQPTGRYIAQAKESRSPQAAAPADMAAAGQTRDAQGLPGHNTEAYDHVEENPFVAVSADPLSTFSIDVDTASYANVRRFLTGGQLPPRGAVRVEEMINYFPYAYEGPSDAESPFAVNVEVGQAPWASKHRLVRIGLKGREVAPAKRPPSNLVFLVDVSGSMYAPNKLPLLKRGLKLLVDKLGENDRVALVVYAGASGVVLDSTSAAEKAKILGAIERLQAGGSTAGAAGITLAYQVARRHHLPGGVNRVILATDGDFNVGPSSRSALVDLVQREAKSGVFLTVLGFGMGNYKDATLEQLADKGNGNYAYIDTLNEARKVLVREMSGTLVTIAKDVKIQVEWNPSRVQAYRLIGYENRMLRHQDFADDKKDAGDIGAGHTVTALYEVVPQGVAMPLPKVGPLKYQQPRQPSAKAGSDELLTVKLRYKRPDGDASKLLSRPVKDSDGDLAQASVDFRFASAVAAFGMLLRGSAHKGGATYASVLSLAREAKGADPHGYRAEFLRLVERAATLAGQRRPG